MENPLSHFCGGNTEAWEGRGDISLVSVGSRDRNLTPVSYIVNSAT